MRAWRVIRNFAEMEPSEEIIIQWMTKEHVESSLERTFTADEWQEIVRSTEEDGLMSDISAAIVNWVARTR